MNYEIENKGTHTWLCEHKKDGKHGSNIRNLQTYKLLARISNRFMLNSISETYDTGFTNMKGRNLVVAKGLPSRTTRC